MCQTLQTTTRSSPQLGSFLVLCWVWHMQVVNFEVIVQDFMFNEHKYFWPGTFIAILAIPIFPNQINSIEELVRQKNIPWAIQSDTSLMMELKQFEQGTSLRDLHDGAIARQASCAQTKDQIKKGEFVQVCSRLQVWVASTQ
jgi:hypothetical protein